MNKYKVGSNILHLDNCGDADYVVLSNVYGNYKMVYNPETKEDLIYIDTEYLQSLLTYTVNNRQLLIYNYQYDRAIIGTDFPIEYHIIEYRNELFNYIKDILHKKLFNFDKRIRCNEIYCSKLIYHIAYNIFILQNNSPIITEDQKAIVQQIHDGLMPIEYIDTLTEMFNKLAQY